MELIVYICGPITGEDPLACKLKFLAMEVRLKNMGVHTVINPKNMGIPSSWPWDRCMETCMEVLAKANVIVLLNGWKESKGARMEKEYAEKHDYLIVEEDGLDGMVTLIRHTRKWMDISPLEKHERKWVDTSHLEFP